jgi:hypothetical protein
MVIAMPAASAILSLRPARQLVDLEARAVTGGMHEARSSLQAWKTLRPCLSTCAVATALTPDAGRWV